MDYVKVCLDEIALEGLDGKSVTTNNRQTESMYFSRLQAEGNNNYNS